MRAFTVPVLQAFVFKIVPMINPDGVALGNNRCSLAAVDLNRFWCDPSESAHPVIFAAKVMMAAFLVWRVGMLS